MKMSVDEKQKMERAKMRAKMLAKMARKINREFPVANFERHNAVEALKALLVI